jgi:glutathione S-transferase
MDIRTHAQNVPSCQVGQNKNPLGEIPVLERSDGTFLSESISICEYLDATCGPTGVVGRTADERADVSMWVRRVEQKVTDKQGDAFRFSPKMAKFFASRRGSDVIDPTSA